MKATNYLLALLSASLLIHGPLSVGAQGPPVSELKLEPYTFEAGNGRRAQAELGRLAVPAHHHNPRGPSIELVFVRFKGTAAIPGPPIVYLAGGPGNSGIDTARGSRFDLFMAMRELGDVIALDQRGTGMSLPSLNCSDSLGYPVDKPGDRDALLRRFKEASRACTETLRRRGIDLSAYNTDESADDLDDLRRALGAEKITLWSISYGTHLALAAIRRHEPRIHRAILAGVEGPDHTLKTPRQIQDNLEKLSSLAKDDPGINGRVPDLMQLVTTVLARLEKDPIIVEFQRANKPMRVAVGKFDLQRLTASIVGNSEARLIPLVYVALSQGDTSHPAVVAIAERLAEQRQGAIGSAMPFAMDCASGASRERRGRIEREANQTVLGGTVDFPTPEICAAWGDLELGSVFRAPVQTGVPTLLISGTLDARTPVSNAEEVRRGFHNSTELIIDGAFHSDPLFLSSPQIKDVMVEFLKGNPPPTRRIVLPPLRFTPIP